MPLDRRCSSCWRGSGDRGGGVGIWMSTATTAATIYTWTTTGGTTASTTIVAATTGWWGYGIGQ